MIRHRSIVRSETIVMDDLRLVRLVQEIVNLVCHSRRIHIRSEALQYFKGAFPVRSEFLF